MHCSSHSSPLSVRALTGRARFGFFSAWSIQPTRLDHAAWHSTATCLPIYHPLLPVDSAPYHYGFMPSPRHYRRCSAAIWRIYCSFWQLLNALLVLAVYGGGVLMTSSSQRSIDRSFSRRTAALFSAYYVSWGRYTQLTGMLLFSVLVGCHGVSAPNQPGTRLTGTATVIDYWQADYFSSMCASFYCICHYSSFLGFNRARAAQQCSPAGLSACWSFCHDCWS